MMLEKIKISEFVVDKPIGMGDFKPIKCTLYCYGNQPNISTQNVEKELEHYRSQLYAVNKKLSNKNFLNKAPKEIIEKEQKKKNDFEQKIQLIEKQQNI